MNDLIPLDRRTAATMRWNPPASLFFVRELPLLPIDVVEAGGISSVQPICLQKDASQSSGWNLMAVCGLAIGDNDMVDRDNHWRAAVVPNCIRYLPFTMTNVGGGKGVVAIAPRFGRHVLVQGDGGVPLYGEDGELHPAAQKRVQALIDRHPKILRTQKALIELAESGLIVPWPESLVKNANITLLGLHTVDEKKLSQLDDETFLALRKSGALALAYSCLLSLYQVRNLVNKGSVGKPVSDKAVQTTGDLDLEFLKDDDTIKFGPLS